MQKQERDYVPGAVGGQCTFGPQQECARGGSVRARCTSAASSARARRCGSRKRSQQQRMLREGSAQYRGPGSGTTEDGYPSLYLRVAQVPRHVPALALSSFTRFPGRRCSHVVADCRPIATVAGVAGKYHKIDIIFPCRQHQVRKGSFSSLSALCLRIINYLSS